MYAIQIDEQNWCRGIEAGWLIVTPEPTTALLFQTQTEAEEALQLFTQTNPQYEYRIQLTEFRVEGEGV